MEIHQNITNWITKIINDLNIDNQNIKRSKNIIDMPTNSILELLNIINLYFYKNDNNTNTNITMIVNNNKNHNKITVQVYNPQLLSFFQKKELNDNWTYLKSESDKSESDKYQLRWKLDIHLYQSNSKSYTVISKKKKYTKKIENTNSFTKTSHKDVSFNQISDSD